MRRKKRAITLLEIMIVILIIGLIGGVLGYQMKGSLDEGKAFKSREGISKLESILNLQVAQGWDAGEIVKDKEYLDKCLKDSGLIKDTAQLLKGGWGEEYLFSVDTHDQIIVVSEKLKDYDKSKKTRLTNANKKTQG